MAKARIKILLDTVISRHATGTELHGYLGGFLPAFFLARNFLSLGWRKA